MPNFKIKDKKLAKQGKKKIAWARDHMPVLTQIGEQFKKEKPFHDLVIAVSLHVTKETAVLVHTLRLGKAKVALCGCNPLSTQDDVAAALVEDGFSVFAWRGQTNEKYYSCINTVLDFKPDITIDDGLDLISTIHAKRRELLRKIRGGCEETTMGVNRLRAMEKDGALKYPVIAVNDAFVKHLFDNRYGTGQSAIDGILRATSILLAGKKFVVCGYGWCGRGIATRARGMGADVIVTEVDPVRALEAVMDGFIVKSLSSAIEMELTDIVVTATGDTDVVTIDHIKKMRDGVILANAGHLDREIDVSGLKKEAVRSQELRPNTVEYTLKGGKKVYLLGEGRIINLVAAEGHPSEVMDMSFATQALSAEYINKNYKKLEPKVYNTPLEQDRRIAFLKLQSMGVNIDRLTPKQKKYLGSWQEGT